MSLNKSKTVRTAEKYVLQGKIGAAIDEYKKVVDADPSDLTTINTLGDLYVRAGRIQDAIINFSRIADSYRESGFTLKAIAMLKKISKLDPTNIETAMKLANLYSQQGLLVEARQQYLQVADAYARVGQTRKALEAYQKIADLDPSNTAVRMKLGEIYSRERMPEQAHESFITAGAEFLRKGDIEQALNANLKAIAIDPESRQGLSAIATIYTEQGQPDRAINILCEAFERNPGDVELLTILGRTYLSASMMDEAERTFLSLVQLDRNRYNYLLEVGRKFLQAGELDRAAEQIDGCLDVLITKREEDKAIDFLRRILDRDMNHLGSLKRLAQIFMRIREDHNLIASLNSLAEAALRKGDEEEAIAALKELVKLEPDEPLHLQRLYNLGVKDVAASDSSDMVRATGPLDYGSAAYDDAFVVRQISEAELLSGHGQVDHAISILKGILEHTPENLQVHQKLKDIYLRAGMMGKAAKECLDLARIHQARGESARASDCLAEARQLDPLLDVPETPDDGASWLAAANDAASATGFALPADASPAEFALPESSNGVSAHASINGFDLTPSATRFDGAAENGFEMAGAVDSFANIYGSDASGNDDGFAVYSSAAAYPEAEISEQPSAWNAFDDPSVFLSNATSEPSAPALSPAERAYASGYLTPEFLKDELDSIDFYIAQGYFDIARNTLDRLCEEHGNLPDLMKRYQQLGVEDDVPPASAPPQPEEAFSVHFDTGTFDASNAASNGSGGLSSLSEGTADEAGTHNNGQQNFMPLVLKKESGPLYPDLMVKFNTSELLKDSIFDYAPPQSTEDKPAPLNIGTADLIQSIVSDIDAAFDMAPESASRPQIEAPPVAISTPEARPIEESPFGEMVGGGYFPDLPTSAGTDETLLDIDHRADFQEIVEEVTVEAPSAAPALDFETHYSLGLAYKDMDLLEDAIEQFQLAYKQASSEEHADHCSQCCNMLGLCFKRKGMGKLAVMWFERGLQIASRTEDEYQALRYEIGSCYEETGDTEKALDAYLEVYAVDVNYRQVGDKIKQLQTLKTT